MRLCFVKTNNIIISCKTRVMRTSRSRSSDWRTLRLATKRNNTLVERFWDRQRVVRARRTTNGLVFPPPRLPASPAIVGSGGALLRSFFPHLLPSATGGPCFTRFLYAKSKCIIIIIIISIKYKNIISSTTSLFLSLFTACSRSYPKPLYNV